jgi:hydroxyethylthiazole kinase-like uncharacterized protein yjeF
MIGAPALAAQAALRAGAGLAKLAVPKPIVEAALTITPSATGEPVETRATGEVEPHAAACAIDACLGTCDCLVVGPGMGTGDGARAASLRSVQQEHVPVVVDADAINCLAHVAELHRDFHAAAVLTPHPGEYRRLAAALSIDADPVNEASRTAACEQLAQRLGCVVVLKGAGTVVSDGHRSWTNSSGSSALATGGTGDVLAGVIAGLVAQYVSPPTPCVAANPKRADKPLDLYDAARIGVWAHGYAAELWVQRSNASAGLLASELASLIPEALERLRTG